MLQRVRSLLAQRFAADGAIDYSLIGLLSISILVTSILTWVDYRSPLEVLILMLVNIVAVAICVLLVVLLEAGWRRSQTERWISLGPLIALGAALGAVKGVLTWLGLTLLGVEQQLIDGLAGRTAFSSITGAVVVPVLALFGSLRLRYSRQRKALIAQRALEEREESYPAALLGFIEETKRRMSDLGSAGGVGGLSQELRDIIDFKLRPLSQRIWAQESKRFPSFKLSQIAKVALVGHVYSAGWIVPIWFVTSLAATTRVFGYEAGIAIQAARALILLFGLLLAARFKPRNYAEALAIYVTTIATIILVQLLFSSSIIDNRSPLQYLALVLASLIWLVQLTLFVGMAKAFLQMGQKLEGEFAEILSDRDLEELKANREVALRERQLANYLHGHLQSRLNLIATQLDGELDSASISAGLKRVELALDQALDQFGKQHVSSVDEAISNLERDWGGVVQLSFAFNAGDLNPAAVNTIREVANEAIANAVRHGFASRVNVLIGDGPEVTITDDGTGPRNGPPGLGSSYFEAVASDWQLSDNGSGSTLRLRLRAG